MTKSRIRTRIVYRDRPVRVEHSFSSLTIGQIKQWLFVMAPIVIGLWAFAGPFVQAQAADYLKTQLVLIGMDPATVQTLNKNLMDLQSAVQQKDEATRKLSDDVGELKSQLGTVLKLMEIQVLKGAPHPPVDDAVK